jgi:hypothetical protein
MTDYPMDLVDTDLVARRREALLAAMANRDRVMAEIRAAEAALRDAVAARNELIERQGKEGGVTMAESLAARQAVADAETHLLLLREGEASAQRGVDAAQRALDAASGEAHRPVLEWAIDERIEAAADIDVAEAQLTRAKDRYAHAGEIAAAAMLHGAKHPNPPFLNRGPFGRFHGEHAEAERRAWGRPVKVPPVAAE